MSGKKGMRYHEESTIKEVFRLKEIGMTNREIAEHLNFRNVKAVKNLINLHNRKQKYPQIGIPRPKGRHRKDSPLTTDQEKDNEIKRLKMENELLRSFLQIAGRK